MVQQLEYPYQHWDYLMVFMHHQIQHFHYHLQEQLNQLKVVRHLYFQH